MTQVVTIPNRFRDIENMKETVLDVLMYLFDKYVDEDFEITPDRESLKIQLRSAGFGDNQVNKAFDWLEGLSFQQENNKVAGNLELKSHRIFNSMEIEKLDTECRGFLIYLEQAGVLDAHKRELVIDRAMALDTDEIDLQQLKWVVLMVLFNQPDNEAVNSWMEDIIMDDISAYLH